MKNKFLFAFGGLFFFLLSEAGYIHVFCLFHKITGLYCPGCGVTRMLDAIFHFSFYQAFRYNPLAFVLLVLFVIDIIISFNVINNFKKTVKSVSVNDRTEDVNKYVKNVLLKKSILHRRLIKSFPKIQTHIDKLKEDFKKK